MPRKEIPQTPTEMNIEKGAELVQNTSGKRLSDGDLERIRLAGYDAVSTQSEGYALLENSIPVVKDKNALVAVPFISIEWRFNQSDRGEFVSATVMTQDNQLHIINDGGTGIYRQYLELTEKRGNQVGPILHAEGLNPSPYWVNADTGETRKQRPDDGGDWRKATTYYLT